MNSTNLIVVRFKELQENQAAFRLLILCLLLVGLILMQGNAYEQYSRNIIGYVENNCTCTHHLPQGVSMDVKQLGNGSLLMLQMAKNTG